MRFDRIRLRIFRRIQKNCILKIPIKSKRFPQSDIFIVSLSGGTARNITAGNKGYDASPAYTPDGKYIIYRSQETEGFEADRWRIMRFNRNNGETVELSTGLDLQADDFAITRDGKTVYFTVNQHGLSPIYSLPVESTNGKNQPSYAAVLRKFSAIECFAGRLNAVFWQSMVSPRNNPRACHGAACALTNQFDLITLNLKKAEKSNGAARQIKRSRIL